MIYYRKIWFFPEMFLLILGVICKYVGPYFIKASIDLLWNADSKFPLNTTNLIAKMQNLSDDLAVFGSKVLYIDILIAVVVLIWLVINLLSGQLALVVN